MTKSFYFLLISLLKIVQIANADLVLSNGESFAVYQINYNLGLSSTLTGFPLVIIQNSVCKQADLDQANNIVNASILMYEYPLCA